MPTSSVRLRLTLAEAAAGYIRYVRAETLAAIHSDPHPELVEPMPHAIYLLAHVEGRDEPVGLAEAAFLAQHYGSYEQVPYSGVADLRSFCTFEQLAGIRTVYTDPAFRHHHGLYLKLILGQAYLFRLMGARYAAATTNASNDALARLYDKTGGIRVGSFTHEAFKDPIAVFLFELDRLLDHPLSSRMLQGLEVDQSILTTVRMRGRGSALAS